MSGVRVLVGTRKGAFILSSDGKRDRWEVSGPHFAGWEVYHVKGSTVDPNRIYLGGHSSGGTLALLVGETTDKFRAIVSFGPIAHVADYGGDLVYCDPNDENEMNMRSPVLWLRSIRTPTFVFEGSDGNYDSLRLMRQLNENARVQFFEVGGTDHFSILGPMNKLIAAKLVSDTGADVRIAFEDSEIARLFQ